MKTTYRELLRKFQFPLLLVTGIMSIVLYIYGKQGIPFFWVIPSIYLAFAFSVMGLPRKLRWFLGAGGAAILLALGVLLPGGTVSALCGAAFAIVCLLTVPMAGWDWQEELPQGIYWAGLASHGLCYLLAVIRRTEGNPLPEQVTIAMGLCFLCYALLVLLGLNRQALGHAALGRHTAAASVRRRNLLLILSFFLLTGLVAFTPALSHWLYLGFRLLIGWLTSLAQRRDTPSHQPAEDITFPNDVIPENTPIDNNSAANRLHPDGVPWINERADSPLPWVFMGCVIVLILLALPLLLRLLSRLLKKLITPGEDSYVDEVTAIRPEKTDSKAESPQEKRKAVFGRLTPTQKIRRHYARLMKKHRWDASRTARENLTGDAAQLYEHARYSGQEATAQQAERFAQQAK